MNYIINLSNDPNSLTNEQMLELKNTLNNAVKNKIAKLENKYNIKIKFPTNTCDLEKKHTSKIPIPILPTFITSDPLSGQISLNAYVPFDALIQNTTDENNIDKLSSCMQIVNSVKKEFELFDSGKKTKEQIDSTFFDWNNADTNESNEPIYEHEIDELYAKKFGNKELIKKLIEKLELSESYGL